MTNKLGRAVAACVWTVALACAPARAQELEPTEEPVAEAQASASGEDPLQSSFLIDDENPENSVPTPEEANKKPLQMGYHLMMLSERADAATARGDHLAAAKYWIALGKAVPDRSISYVRACKAFEAAGDLARAADECRKALGKGGVTVDDNLRFVEVLLRKPGNLTESEIADVDAVASHLQKEIADEPGEVAQNLVLCQLGTRINDAERLKKCTSRLQVLAPNDPKTVIYNWSLAMLERDFDRANTVLDGAKEAKLTSGVIRNMRETVQAAREKQTHVETAAASQSWLYRGLPLLLLALTLFAFYKFRQRTAQT